MDLSLWGPGWDGMVWIGENYTHLSKLKEWTQRHVEYSESQILMRSCKIGAWRADTPKAVTTSIIFCSVQGPPQVPHWLSTVGCIFFSVH
jgi:hypothetical protein